MKRFVITALVFGMVLCASGCAGTENQETAAETTISVETTISEETTMASDEMTDTSVNEGEFKAGVYTGTATYADGSFSMTWNFALTFGEDGTFVLKNDAGEEKGAGTYALTDTCYTMSYSDGRSCSFVVQQDGTLKLTSDFPYGSASIELAPVGGIVLDYSGDAPEETVSDETTAAEENNEESGNFSIAAGNYTASYTKESAMAGTVVYNYSAVIGEDGTFSYNVTFNMGDTKYDGSAASGTYVVDGDKFTFTDSEGNVIEGKLEADNTLVISLMASSMAKEPYEVTFTIAE